MSSGKHVFGGIAEFSYKNARLILVLFSILILISPLFLKDLRLETALSVVEIDDPMSRVYQETTEIFGDSVPLVIYFERGNVPQESMDGLTDRLAETVSSWPDILDVDSGPINLKHSGIARAIIRSALINSPPETFDAFAAKFKKDGILKELRKTRKKLLTASDPDVQAALVFDVLNLREILLPFFETRMGNLRFSPNSLYYDNEENTRRLIFIFPRGLSEDTRYSSGLIDRVSRTVLEIKNSYPQAASLEFRLSGKYAQSAEGTQILQRDMQIISLWAGLLIFLLMALVLRSFRSVLVAFSPLLAAVVSVLLFARFFFNPLNPVAIAFAAILIGLGIDVMIHCAGRFFQLQENEPSIETAIRRTLEDCGPPVSIGMTTTAAAFACLAFAKFRALAAFGLLTASGLMITLAVSLFLFPAVVRVVFPKGSPRMTGLRFQSVPQALFEASRSRPYLAIGLGLCLLAGSLFFAKNFRFEMDIYKGLPDDMESLRTAREIARTFGVSLTHNTQLFVQAPDYESAMALQKSLDQKLERLLREGKITGFQSPSLFAVYPDTARDKLTRIRETALLIRENRIAFEAALDDLRFNRTVQLEDYYDLVENVFTPNKISMEEWGREAADIPIAGKNIRFTGSAVYLQTYVWPLNDEDDFSVVKDISAEFQSFPLPAGVRLDVLGSFQYFEHINMLIRSDFYRVSLFGLLAVGLLALLFFRNLPRMLIALTPLAAAIPLTFALLEVLGLSFTPAGIGMTAMVVGIGIDDAVHILTRIKSVDFPDQKKILASIAPILALTTISTAIGFGALLLSRLYSIRTMGLAVAIGVLSCFLFTVLFLPSFLALRGRRRTRTAKSPVILLLLFLLPFSPARGQESELNDLLSRLEEKYEATDSLSCRFTQTKSISQLVGKTEFKGEMIFRKPHFLHLELRGEENLNIFADGETIWLEDLDYDEVESFPFAALKDSGRLSRLVPPLFLSGSEDLRSSFDIELLPNEGDRHVLELTPKSLSPITRIRFAVDPQSRINWMTIFYSNGDFAETRFRDWKKLPRISKHFFRYRKD
jgi:predicted RND superfamily exporter protein/outer membrane lipoprotein-sorting protein